MLADIPPSFDERQGSHHQLIAERNEAGNL